MGSSVCPACTRGVGHQAGVRPSLAPSLWLEARRTAHHRCHRVVRTSPSYRLSSGGPPSRQGGGPPPGELHHEAPLLRHDHDRGVRRRGCCCPPGRRRRPGGSTWLVSPSASPGSSMDAVARPVNVTNPVDLGSILVPHGWLLLGPEQSGLLDVAAICRDRDEPDARVRAFFGSAPGREMAAPVALKEGRKQELALKLPETFEDPRSRRAPGRPRRWPGRVARGKVDSGNAGAEAPALASVRRQLHQAALRRADLGPRSRDGGVFLVEV